MAAKVFLLPITLHLTKPPHLYTVKAGRFGRDKLAKMTTMMRPDEARAICRG